MIAKSDDEQEQQQSSNNSFQNVNTDVRHKRWDTWANVKNSLHNLTKSMNSIGMILYQKNVMDRSQKDENNSGNSK